MRSPSSLPRVIPPRECSQCSAKLLPQGFIQYRLNGIMPVGKHIHCKCSRCKFELSIRTIKNLCLLIAQCIVIPFLVPVALKRPG